MPKLLSELDYLVPEFLKDELVVGQLVEIPLGKGTTYGLVSSEIHQADLPQSTRLKPIQSSISKLPAFSPEQVDFLQELTLRYNASLGFLVKNSLFPLQKKALKTFADLQKTSLQNFPTKEPSIAEAFYYKNETEHTRFLLEKLEKNRQNLILLPEVAAAEDYYAELKDKLPQLRLITAKTTLPKFRELWFELWSGTPLTIIGTQRALFLPWQNLATVILDDEANPSHKRFDLAPRFHSRDAVELLTSLHKAQYFTTGHTPSIASCQTFFSASASKKLPPISNLFQDKNLALLIVDMKQERRIRPGSLIGLRAEDALEKTKDGISFLFLNQRGNAQHLSCKDCGFVYICPNCGMYFTYHEATKKLLCHGCQTTIPLTACPKCKGFTIQRMGYGTASLEDRLKSMFSNRPVVRSDSDESTTDLTNLAPGTIIVGTQHAWTRIDWKTIQLAVFVDADTSLHVPEYTVGEELLYALRDAIFRLPAGATCIVQTHQSEHSVFKNLSHPTLWYKEELTIRKTLAYPPFSTLLKLWKGEVSPQVLEQECAKVLKTISGLTEGGKKAIVSQSIPMVPFKKQGQYWRVIIIKILEKDPYPLIKKILSELPASWKADINPERLLS
jgi:primosomal protein N' (replication factor Y)